MVATDAHDFDTGHFKTKTVPLDEAIGVWVRMASPQVKGERHYRRRFRSSRSLLVT